MTFVAAIPRLVAEEFAVTVEKMREPDGCTGARLRDHARPRQVAMFFSCELTRHSTVRIGQFFGGRDHSTVLEARKQVKDRWRSDPELRAQMQRVFAQIGGR